MLVWQFCRCHAHYYFQVPRCYMYPSNRLKRHCFLLWSGANTMHRIQLQHPTGCTMPTVDHRYKMVRVPPKSQTWCTKSIMQSIHTQVLQDAERSLQLTYVCSEMQQIMTKWKICFLRNAANSKDIVEHSPRPKHSLPTKTGIEKNRDWRSTMLPTNLADNKTSSQPAEAKDLGFPPFWYHVWYLVGGLEHFLFSHILGITIPTD